MKVSRRNPCNILEHFVRVRTAFVNASKTKKLDSVFVIDWLLDVIEQFHAGAKL